MEKEKLAFSVKETARLLGLHYNTVYRLIREGKLPTITLGTKKLVPKAELERLGLEPKESPAGQGGVR